MSTQPLVLHHGRVLQRGARRLECLDRVMGTDGRLATLTPPAPCHTDAGDRRGGVAHHPGCVDADHHGDKMRTRHEVPSPTGTLVGAMSQSSESPGVTSPHGGDGSEGRAAPGITGSQVGSHRASTGRCRPRWGIVWSRRVRPGVGNASAS
jgi:hypothetical protein